MTLQHLTLGSGWGFSVFIGGVFLHFCFFLLQRRDGHILITWTLFCLITSWLMMWYCYQSEWSTKGHQLASNIKMGKQMSLPI